MNAERWVISRGRGTFRDWGKRRDRRAGVAGEQLARAEIKACILGRRILRDGAFELHDCRRIVRGAVPAHAVGKRDPQQSALRSCVVEGGGGATCARRCTSCGSAGWAAAGRSPDAAELEALRAAGW